jgi:UDP-glucose 4-epimerase
MIKRYLILGATGLIGSNIAKFLLTIDNRNEVTLLARNESKLYMLSSHLGMQDRTNIIVHDLTEVLDFENKYDVVINAASYTGQNNIINDPQDIVKSNTLGTMNSLNFVKNSSNANKTRYIYLSSITVYGDNRKDKMEENSGFNFTGQSNLSRIYAYSKLIAEEYVVDFVNKFDLDCYILRISSVYGYSVNKPNTALYSILEELVNTGAIKLISSSFPNKDYIYVKDVVSAIHLISENSNNFRIYNVSSNGMGGNYTNLPNILIKIISRLNSNGFFKTNRIMDTNRLVFTETSKMDNSRLISEGWFINWNLDESIDDFVESFLLEESR